MAVLALVISISLPAKARDYLSTFMLATQASIEHQYLDARSFMEDMPAASFDHAPVNSLALEVYLGAGEFDQALDYAYNVIETDPSDILANLTILTGAFIEGDFEEVLRLSQSDEWNDYRKTFFEGWAHFALGDSESALAIWNAESFQQLSDLGRYSSGLILAHEDHYGTAIGVLGNLFEYDEFVQPEGLYLYLTMVLAMGQLDEARQVFNSLNIASNNPRSIVLRDLRTSVNDDALPDFDFSLTAEKGLATSLLVFGRIIGEGYQDDAVETFRLASFVNPSDPLTHFELSEYFSQLESHDLALLALDPIDDNGLYALPKLLYQADILALNDNLAESAKILQDASPNFADSYDFWLKLGEIQFYERQYRSAVDSITRALSISGPDEEELLWYPYFLRGASHDFMEEHGLMEIDFRQALELDPDNHQVLNHFGYSLAVRDIALDDAKEMIVRALELSPKNGAYLDSLGWVYFRKGNYEEAERYLLEADLVSPDEFEIVDHIGDLYWVTGRQGMARQEWQRALELEPTDKIRTMIELKLKLGLEEAERLTDLD